MHGGRWFHFQARVKDQQVLSNISLIYKFIVRKFSKFSPGNDLLLESFLNLSQVMIYC